MDNIAQGLFILGVGMLVLFLALGALALVVGFMGKVFKEKSSAPQENSLFEKSVDKASLGSSSESPASAVAVAVAVSHLLVRQGQNSNLGKVLEQPPGGYRIRHTFRDKPVIVIKRERVK